MTSYSNPDQSSPNTNFGEYLYPRDQSLRMDILASSKESLYSDRRHNSDAITDNINSESTYSSLHSILNPGQGIFRYRLTYINFNLVLLLSSLNFPITVEE